MPVILAILAIMISGAAAAQTAQPMTDECGPWQQQYQELLKNYEETANRLVRAEALLKGQQELLKRQEELLVRMRATRPGPADRIPDDTLAPKYRPPLSR